MKIKSLFIKISFGVTVTFLTVTIFCGEAFSANFSSPISPALDERDKIIGGILGFGQNVQNGTALVDCQECEFTNGLDFGYTVGMSYEEQLSADDRRIFYYFTLGGILHLSNRNISANYQERTSQYFANYDMNFPILFEHNYSTSIQTVGLMPYISFNPAKYFFVKFGFDISYIFNNNLKHEIELLEKRKTLPNGEVVDIFIPTANPNRKSYSQMVQDSEIKNINKLQMSLVPALGFNIYLTDKLTVTPSLNYNIALDKISGFDNYKINAWRANIELKYNLSESNKIFKPKQALQ